MVCRMTTIEAGKMVKRYVYPPARGRGAGRPPGELYDPTSAVRQMLNDKRCWKSLSLWLHAYYSMQSYFLTLSYDSAHLPMNYNDAKKKVVAFLRKFREECNRQKIPYSYVYVLEGAHGDKRIHHHVVVLGEAQARIVQDLWKNGSVHPETIREFGYSSGGRGTSRIYLPAYIAAYGKKKGTALYEHECFVKLAKYMTKEPRKTGRIRPGGRAYTPSRDHPRPLARVDEVEISGPLDIPPGYVELEHSRPPNDYIQCEEQILWRDC